MRMTALKRRMIAAAAVAALALGSAPASAQEDVGFAASGGGLTDLIARVYQAMAGWPCKWELSELDVAR